jgi:Uma2 family endonuclease
MSAATKRKLTATEYLAIEREAPFKSEFYNGEMFAMAGASREHNRIKENLIIETGGRLRGVLCQSFSSDQRVQLTPTGMFVYPDFLVVCDPPRYSTLDRDSLVNPGVVVEVLSPSTEGYDRGFKFAQYQLLPSIREYVLVSQDRARIERFVRQPNDRWELTVFADPAGEFAFETVPVSIPLTAVYAGVEFPDPGPPQKQL